MCDDGNQSQGRAAPGQEGEHAFRVWGFVGLLPAEGVARREVDQDQPDDDGPNQVDAAETHLQQPRSAKLGCQRGHPGEEDSKGNVASHGANYTCVQSSFYITKLNDVHQVRFSRRITREVNLWVAGELLKKVLLICGILLTSNLVVQSGNNYMEEL